MHDSAAPYRKEPVLVVGRQRVRIVVFGQQYATQHTSLGVELQHPFHALRYYEYVALGTFYVEYTSEPGFVSRVEDCVAHSAHYVAVTQRDTVALSGEGYYVRGG